MLILHKKRHLVNKIRKTPKSAKKKRTRKSAKIQRATSEPSSLKINFTERAISSSVSMESEIEEIA